MPARAASQPSAAAAGDSGRNLWAFYAWEDLLLVCVPASFILSYILRRVCIEPKLTLEEATELINGRDEERRPDDFALDRCGQMPRSSHIDLGDSHREPP